MEKTLVIKIKTNKAENTFSTHIFDYETGDGITFDNNVYSPDEHPEFNEKIGTEIYGWVDLMMDEED